MRALSRVDPVLQGCLKSLRMSNPVLLAALVLPIQLHEATECSFPARSLTGKDHPSTQHKGCLLFFEVHPTGRKEVARWLLNLLLAPRPAPPFCRPAPPTARSSPSPRRSANGPDGGKLIHRKMRWENGRRKLSGFKTLLQNTLLKPSQHVHHRTTNWNPDLMGSI